MNKKENINKSKNDLNYFIATQISETFNHRLQHNNTTPLYVYCSYVNRSDSTEKDWKVILIETDKDHKLEEDSILIHFEYDKKLKSFIPLSCKAGLDEPLLVYYSRLGRAKIKEILLFLRNRYFDIINASTVDIGARIFALVDIAYLEMCCKGLHINVDKLGCHGR